MNNFGTENIAQHTKCSNNRHIQRVAKKSSPPKFFAIFSATTWNFDMEFYRFIYRNVLHL